MSCIRYTYAWNPFDFLQKTSLMYRHYVIFFSVNREHWARQIEKGWECRFFPICPRPGKTDVIRYATITPPSRMLRNTKPIPRLIVVSKFPKKSKSHPCSSRRQKVPQQLWNRKFESHCPIATKFAQSWKDASRIKQSELRNPVRSGLSKMERYETAMEMTHKDHCIDILRLEELLDEFYPK